MTNKRDAGQKRIIKVFKKIYKDLIVETFEQSIIS